MPRLTYLDGMRGWAAVVVVLFHAFVQATPVVPDTIFLGRFLFLSGGMAVFCFFVISAIALSTGYLASGRIDILIRLAASRYVRLALPILAACAAVHTLLVMGLLDTSHDRLAPFHGFLEFEPTLRHLLRFALFDVFFGYSTRISYIGPLWTMQPELFGSMLTFATILIVKPLTHRAAALLPLSAALFYLADTEWQQMLAVFPLGIVIGDTTLRGLLDRAPGPIGWLMVLAGVSIPLLFPYGVLAWGLLAAPLLIAGCIAVRPIRILMEGSASQWLGWLSFPLYLVHGPVICLIGEPLIRHQPSTITRLVIDTMVVGISFLVAIPFAIFVNDPAVVLSRAIGQRAASLWTARPSSAPAP